MAGTFKTKKKKDLSHENKVTGHHFRQLLTIPQILLVRTMENVYMTVRRINKLILRTKELTSRAKFSVSQCSPFQAVTGNIYRHGRLKLLGILENSTSKRIALPV